MRIQLSDALELVSSGGDLYSGGWKAWDLFSFNLYKALVFYFSLEEAMGLYPIFRDILNLGLRVYSWHKFNARVGTINDFFNCMPN